MCCSTIQPTRCSKIQVNNRASMEGNIGIFAGDNQSCTHRSIIICVCLGAESLCVCGGGGIRAVLVVAVYEENRVPCSVLQPETPRTARRCRNTSSPSLSPASLCSNLGHQDATKKLLMGFLPNWVKEWDGSHRRG